MISCNQTRHYFAVDQRVCAAIIFSLKFIFYSRNNYIIFKLSNTRCLYKYRKNFRHHVISQDTIKIDYQRATLSLEPLGYQSHIAMLSDSSMLNETRTINYTNKRERVYSDRYAP